MGGNDILQSEAMRNSIIYKDQELEKFIKEQAIDGEDAKLEQDRQKYLRGKKKTEDEEQLYQNLLEQMFPGYALNYY